MLYAYRNGKSASVRQSSMVAQKTPIAAEIAERARRAIAAGNIGGRGAQPPQVGVAARGESEGDGGARRLS
jgi:hypothetical protein